MTTPDERRVRRGGMPGEPSCHVATPPGACRATSGRLPPGGPATYCDNATNKQARPAGILAGSLPPRPRRDGRPHRRTGQDGALLALARRAAAGH